MTLSEMVQIFFQENYVLPARGRGQASVEVKAGDLHSKLGWTRRVPVVCAALSSQKLQRKVGVRLAEKVGPPSGQSPTVIYRFEILDRDSSPGLSDEPPLKRGLLTAYGVAAHLYQQVGGSDAFLKAERDDFGSIVPEIDDSVSEMRADEGLRRV